MNKGFSRLGLALILSLLLLLSCGVPAFAYYNDEEENEGVTVEEVDITPSPIPQTQEPSQSSSGLITPDGNMSLVDDLDFSVRGGLQFMTVTTRSGHVFYIVIDRTANSQNVYFLNQVDEYDLMSIMSDAEKDQYEQDQKTHQQQTPQNVVPIQPTEDGVSSEMPAENNPQQFSLGSNLKTLAIFVVIGLIAALLLYFLKYKPNKKNDGFDEDVDFEDDEEYENEDEPVEDLSAEDF